MEFLGLQSLITGNGKSMINGFSICGKGCVGLVFLARGPGGLVALKIRRTDAGRNSMDDEAKFLQLANDAGTGPKYLGHTKNLLAMEFVEGKSMIEWVKSASASQFRKAARSVLDQCFKLDLADLDHGELSRLGRHVIVSPNCRPFIIDFESASISRRTSNVTSAAQSLFLYGAVAGLANIVTSKIDKDATVAALRKYKHLRSRKSYRELVEFLTL